MFGWQETHLDLPLWSMKTHGMLRMLAELWMGQESMEEELELSPQMEEAVLDVEAHLAVETVEVVAAVVSEEEGQGQDHPGGGHHLQRDTEAGQGHPLPSAQCQSHQNAVMLHMMSLTKVQVAESGTRRHLWKALFIFIL